MRKIFYSGVLKFFAFILVCASLTAAVYELVDVIARYCKEEKRVYGFEENFSEANYFNPDLFHLANTVSVTIEDYYIEKAKNNTPAVTYGTFGEDDITVNSVISDDVDYGAENDKDNMIVRVFPVREGIKLYNNSADIVINSNSELWNTVGEALEDFYDSEMLSYYITVNGKAFTNCSAQSAEELTGGRFYLYINRDKNGHMAYDSGHTNHYAPLFDSGSFDVNNTEITFCAAVKEEYVWELETLWVIQAEYIKEAFIIIVGYVLAFLFSLVYLICVCGKDASGENKASGIDKIWTEVHMASVFLFVFVTVGFIVVAVDEYLFESLPMYILQTITVVLPAFSCAAAVTSLLSLVRKVKHGMFFKSSLVFKILRGIWKIIRKTASFAVKGIKSAMRLVSCKTGLIYVSMLLAYTGIVFYLGIRTIIFSPVWLFFAVLLFAFTCVLLLYRASEHDRIRRGASEVRNGNLSHKIDGIHNGDLKLLADSINDIAKGLDESVSAKLKAERLKTELITNVSHDLKTPLTSIISYTELLAGVDDLPEQARDYIQIISKKAERLKNLTQDLFDISKVQSGNEHMNLEKLDISLLINQALGEHDSEITESELTFCVDVQNELFIMADGRKMSRVISNLISNILKYSMKNTRVYITASRTGDRVTAEFKNISECPLNFDSEEITGRFVRGDESRSLDGNGLGLAIAKSYTQACGGQFRVVTDGDLFKAVMEFDAEK